MSEHKKVNGGGVLANVIFKQADADVSLTASMDEADVEVAGIYKAYSVSSTLTRADSAGEGMQTVGGQGHKIELVDTPDCTSIDTEIPEEELRQFQKGLERRLEVDAAIERNLVEEDGVKITISQQDEDENQNNILPPKRPVYSIAWNYWMIRVD